MSRCFPYPPPGYYRNGATHDALIESIKLQKETIEMKAQRKNEKKAKKEKKDKRHKHSKNNKDSADCKEEAQIKKTKAISELFEKSDLTEEHGQPISPNQPSYSSDSTQNSNKRKRDDYSLLADNSTGHGSFKIRLFKKQKGSDSRNFVADIRSNIYSYVSSPSNLENGTVSSIQKDGGTANSVRENRTQAKSNLIAEGAKISDTDRLQFGRVQSSSSFAKPFLQCNRPQHFEHEIPTPFVSRNIVQGGRQQQPTTSSHHGMLDLTSMKTSTSAAGGRSINETSTPAKDGLMKPKEAPQKVRLTRSEKKMLKKHAKYEKLIGSWLQPVFQAHLPNEDWLCTSKASNLSISKGEGETCRESAASWQPCARFLTEVDIHALPYTVPF